ncbi:MAG: hypothetical protein PHU88_12790 [candidate division Zixibacteria bacterium]|nr:hypothetical protein [candidate division Zixibacteria bacterium]MDD5426196.1 hypothetical protein [candidate division Zixibacteria bacterium]
MNSHLKLINILAIVLMVISFSFEIVPFFLIWIIISGITVLNIRFFMNAENATGSLTKVHLKYFRIINIAFLICWISKMLVSILYLPFYYLAFLASIIAIPVYLFNLIPHTSFGLNLVRPDSINPFFNYLKGYKGKIVFGCGLIILGVICVAFLAPSLISDIRINSSWSDIISGRNAYRTAEIVGYLIGLIGAIFLFLGLFGLQQNKSKDVDG